MESTRHTEPTNFPVEPGHTRAGRRVGKRNTLFGSFRKDFNRIGLAEGIDGSFLHAALDLAEGGSAADCREIFVEDMLGRREGGVSVVVIVVSLRGRMRLLGGKNGSSDWMDDATMAGVAGDLEIAIKT
jgi:hypothetical protein